MKHKTKEGKIPTIKKLLDLVSLEGLELRYPHELSGGQQQRIALIRALAKEPLLLLLDEPFNNLDPSLKRELLPELKKILKQLHMTVIFVTHDKDEAFMLADQIGFMHKGQIIQMNTPFIVFNQPKNIQVAEFFGEINIISKETHRHFSSLSQHEDDTHFFIRPHHLKIAHKKSPFQAKLIEKHFYGNYTRLIFDYQREFNLSVIDDDRNYIIGRDYYLTYCFINLKTTKQ